MAEARIARSAWRCVYRQDNRVADGRKPEGKFPLWGSLAVPAGLLWGTALGVMAGIVFGNVLIGAAIGAGLGVGIGLTLFAAAIVVASAKI